MVENVTVRSHGAVLNNNRTDDQISGCVQIIADVRDGAHITDESFENEIQTMQPKTNILDDKELVMMLRLTKP